MIAVEAVISMLVFLALFGFIVNLINIYTFHNRMQYAINAAAHDIASLSYPLYYASGAQHIYDKTYADGKPYIAANDDAANKLMDTYDRIMDFSNQLNQLGDFANSVNESIEAAKDRVTNAKDTLIGGVYKAITGAEDGLKGAAAAGVAEEIVPGYMEISGGKSYDELLESYGVTNVNYRGSEMFTEGSHIIKIQVNYDIDVTAFNVFSPSSKNRTGLLTGLKGISEKGNANFQLHLCQCAVTAGWLDGDGKKLSDYGR